MNRISGPRLRSASRLAAAIALSTAAFMVSVPAAAHAAAPTGRYVALGDSYTSGPLIPNQVNLNCLRSDQNYPSLVAASGRYASFSDVSCGGAKTEDILAASSGYLGQPVPAQISAVNAATTLVTVGIGGNDIGFSSILSDCTRDSVRNPFGSPCKDRYTAGGTDQLQARIAAAAPKVASVLRAVRAAAPGARIFVIGYPAVLPDTGFGCWPTVPFAFGDVPYLRGIEKSMNRMLTTAAAAHNAGYVDTYTPSIGHDACKNPGVRWVEGLVPAAPAAPFHPNAAGERGMATAVLATLAS